jgi:hypothetical protein
VTPRELTIPAVCDRFGWTLQQLRLARTLTFPPCHWQHVGPHRLEPVWRADAIDKWAADLRALQVDDPTLNVCACTESHDEREAKRHGR